MPIVLWLKALLFDFGSSFYHSVEIRLPIKSDSLLSTYRPLTRGGTRLNGLFFIRWVLCPFLTGTACL